MKTYDKEECRQRLIDATHLSFKFISKSSFDGLPSIQVYDQNDLFIITLIFEKHEIADILNWTERIKKRIMDGEFLLDTQ